MSDQNRLPAVVEMDSVAFEPPDRHGRARRKVRRSDWRTGGRGIHRWRHAVPAVGAIAGSLGVLCALLLGRLGGPAGHLWAPLALWVPLVGAVLFAFAIAVPSGLARFRASDLVWGIAVGSALRLSQGVLEASSTLSFPSALNAVSQPTALWWVKETATLAAVGPFVEEFFFRAVVLVVVYEWLRSTVGRVTAASAAMLFSAGTFVLAHALLQPVGLAASLQLLTIGLTCGALVLLTGRIWSAFVAHAVYNASFLLLMWIGTSGS